MNLTPRTKFNATLNADGKIVVGVAVTGYDLPISPYLSFGGLLQSSYYVLEHAADGAWEIGSCDANGARVTSYFNTGGAAFAVSTSGYTCAVIAPPGAYIDSTPGTDGLASPAPVVDPTAQNALAAGRGATVGYGAHRGMAMGIGANVSAPNAMAAGFGATVDYGQQGAAALGPRSRPAVPGEMSLGNHFMPHVGFIAVSASVNAADGGTNDLLLVTDATDAAAMSYASISSFMPDGNSLYYADVRVQGTITVTSDDPNDKKVIGIDYMTSHATYRDATDTLYFTATTLFAGSNNIAVTISLNASRMLQAAAPATSGLRIMGLLLVSKIMRSA